MNDKMKKIWSGGKKTYKLMNEEILTKKILY